MSAETVQDGWVPTEDFAARLLLARRHAGLTVRDAASAAGIHYATWSTWERGARPANMAAEVEKISNALGVDRNWLMWGTPKPWETRQTTTARTPVGARAAEQLPRLDSNQQPAGYLSALVAGRFRTTPRYDDRYPRVNEALGAAAVSLAAWRDTHQRDGRTGHDHIPRSVEFTDATQLRIHPIFGRVCVDSDRSVA